MGVGKTRIAIQHLIANYNPFIEVLVVVPKNSVKQSWIDELNKMGKEKIGLNILMNLELLLQWRCLKLK